MLVAPSWSEVGHSECIYSSYRDLISRQSETQQMEVLKEKVEEEEEAERAEQAERAERAERAKKMMRPMEVRKEDTTRTQEMLRDLERKLSEIEVSIPEKPS